MKAYPSRNDLASPVAQRLENSGGQSMPAAEGDDGAWENQYENYHVNSKLGMITGVTEFNGKSRENLAIYPIQNAPDGGVDFGDVNITIPRTYFDEILNEKGEGQK